jgi:DNA invertase Pin-like site-specific DNA recombinase
LEAKTVNITYRRVSTNKQDIGMQAQQDRIIDYARSYSLTITRAFVDDGVSGAVPIGEREGGKQLLETAQKGDVILVAKLDRLFRSTSDAALTIDEWNEKGISLISVGEGFDMTTIYGRAMAKMLSVFAELERHMIGERTRAALANKRSRGEKLGKEVPYGFECQDGINLVPSQPEQTAIALIKDFDERGKSLRAIASELNNCGIKPRRAAQWSQSSIKRILERS